MCVLQVNYCFSVPCPAHEYECQYESQSKERTHLGLQKGNGT